MDLNPPLTFYQILMEKDIGFEKRVHTIQYILNFKKYLGEKTDITNLCYYFCQIFSFIPEFKPFIDSYQSICEKLSISDDLDEIMNTFMEYLVYLDIENIYNFIYLKTLEKDNEFLLRSNDEFLGKQQKNPNSKIKNDNNFKNESKIKQETPVINDEIDNILLSLSGFHIFDFFNQHEASDEYQRLPIYQFYKLFSYDCSINSYKRFIFSEKNEIELNKENAKIRYAVYHDYILYFSPKITFQGNLIRFCDKIYKLYVVIDDNRLWIKDLNNWIYYQKKERNIIPYTDKEMSGKIIILIIREIKKEVLFKLNKKFTDIHFGFI